MDEVKVNVCTLPTTTVFFTSLSVFFRIFWNISNNFVLRDHHSSAKLSAAMQSRYSTTGATFLLVALSTPEWCWQQGDADYRCSRLLLQLMLSNAFPLRSYRWSYNLLLRRFSSDFPQRSVTPPQFTFKDRPAAAALSELILCCCFTYKITTTLVGAHIL